MHHRFRQLAGAPAAVALATGLTMAGTGTARAVPVPAATWNEIFAPEINSNGISLCADNFGSNAQLQNLQLWRCHGYAANGNPQRWQFFFVGFSTTGTPYYFVINVGSGLCMGLDPGRVNAGTVAGSNLVQGDCDTSLALWELVPATNSPDPNNQFELVSVYGGSGAFPGFYAMEANTFLDQNGNRLIAEPSDPWNSAQWFALT
jgi:hypothetical protein